MHWANRLLDPRSDQLKAHIAHHQGANDDEFVDMSLKNCLLLSVPIILLLVGWGLAFGSLSSILIPAMAFLSWSFVYTYLWTRIHRAIHGIEDNWFRRIGPAFRFFRNHHLRHHVRANGNYGTVFPMTDYVFLTCLGRHVTPRRVGARRRGKAKRNQA
jgi:sterol desaturase/sphingolipid hydroxylase (fatty acid hydroxylase superfamily)